MSTISIHPFHSFKIRTILRIQILYRKLHPMLLSLPATVQGMYRLSWFPFRWICYAEKKSHALVPFLSTVRSAQQIVGQLIRKFLPNQCSSLQSKDIYIVTVVSCYDRKLEASRRDFLSPEGSQDIDCVLTSQEIYDLLLKPLPEPVLMRSIQLNIDWWNQLKISSCNDILSSSGGVLLALLHHILSQHPEAVIQ